MNESTGRPVVAINTRHWIPGKMEGVGRFEMNIAVQLSLQHPEVDFHWLFDRKPPKDIEVPANVTLHSVFPKARHPILYSYWYEYAVPKLLKKINADVFFSPDNISSLSANCPCITVIHDINFAHRPNDLPTRFANFYRKQTPLYIKNAAAVITVSEYSKQDIIDQYSIQESKLFVVSNGVSPLFKPLGNSEIAKTRNNISGGKPYFFVLGSIHPRKNLKRTIEAYHLFRERTSFDFPLVIGGRPLWQDSNFTKTLEIDRKKGDIIFTGYLDDLEVANVMGSAFALLFLSLFEGFGVPVIEAFASGVPVIASNTTSIPEIADDASVFANPTSINSIVEAMVDLANDNSKIELIKVKGLERARYFSWEKSAQKTWEIIESVISGNKKHYSSTN